MKKSSAVLKKVFLFFLLFLVVFSSLGLSNTETRRSQIFNEKKVEEMSLLNANVKIYGDKIIEFNNNVKIDNDSSFHSIRNLKVSVIQQVVFDNSSYDNLLPDKKNFYSLFLKLIILPSCSLFCLFIRRWIRLVSNFKIGFIITRYLHLKDGKKQALSFH